MPSVRLLGHEDVSRLDLGVLRTGDRGGQRALVSMVPPAPWARTMPGPEPVTEVRKGISAMGRS
ncbi:hypothetical protein IU433_29760 [Nocardia puris]|uniref:hypothetical protein n=1 Tax=Nocardia puris TaxID=208602 RepID=UPI000B0CE965|nr:hypothetical protein [Nocardia puris]MBF6215105.1 hypothetical protein [Nocardia puris]MBF6369616.1 hypothetical protein [Nocardia puris]MBF6463191.1 hypothetical protein [Nocardia puris]